MWTMSPRRYVDRTETWNKKFYFNIRQDLLYIQNSSISLKSYQFSSPKSQSKNRNNEWPDILELFEFWETRSLMSKDFVPTIVN